MQRDVKALCDGAVGGLAGTAVMSACMVAAEKAGFIDRHPPEEIADAVLDAIGVPDSHEKTEDALAVFLHFAFGIGTGSVFAVLHRRLRLPISPILHGVIFGSLVWFGSYKGWVPRLGIMPPPERDLPGRPQTMLLVHWVYGGILGAVVGRRDKTRDE